jgi:oligosaccharyltransferase complex subunit beta
LITALQARNNARVVFVGSLEFFSNDFFESQVQNGLNAAHPKSGNEELSISLTKWVFKERGVLRTVSIQHHKVGEKSAPAAYTIKENIVMQISKRIEIFLNNNFISNIYS